jgi:hypothetical protein
MSMRPLASALVAVFVAVPCLGQQPAKKTAEKPAAKSPATAEKRMEMPKPPAEMAQLKFFDGNWTCEGTAPDSPMGPGGKMRSSVRSQQDLGGFWQTGTVRATMAGGPSVEGRFHLTYDAGPKQYVMLWVDSMGAYSHQTASGWEGDTIVFTGDAAMGGKRMRSRDTFVKTGDGSFKHSAEMQMDGNWTPTFEETCRKAARAAR